MVFETFIGGSDVLVDASCFYYFSWLTIFDFLLLTAYDMHRSEGRRGYEVLPPVSMERLDRDPRPLQFGPIPIHA